MRGAKDKNNKKKKHLTHTHTHSQPKEVCEGSCERSTCTYCMCEYSILIRTPKEIRRKLSRHQRVRILHSRARISIEADEEGEKLYFNRFSHICNRGRCDKKGSN